MTGWDQVEVGSGRQAGAGWSARSSRPSFLEYRMGNVSRALHLVFRSTYISSTKSTQRTSSTYYVVQSRERKIPEDAYGADRTHLAGILVCSIRV